MADTYALIQDGMVVNTVLASPADPKSSNYVWVDVTTTTPQPAIGWSYNGTSFTSPTPAAVPLNQQYPASAYGQLLINQFTASNTQRDLTSAQLFALASSLGPFYILLQCGSLQAFLDNLSSVPVDGVVITAAIISQFQAAIGAYLAGD